VRPDLALPELECLCASLRRASRAVTQAYENELRPEGLRATQLTLLHVLRRQGSLTQGEIGDLLALDSTTLTRTLGLMESAGWIRWRAGEDRRERHWELTTAGERKWKKALPAWERAQAKARARIGARALETLLADLARVAGGARAAGAAKTRARE
jgi:DNA-binding MarR family transcriptional regulator